MSYKKQELFTLREHLSSPPVFGGVCVDNRFSFFVLPCCVSLRSGFCVVLSVVICAWQRCSVRICLQLFMGRSCLVCVVCVGLHVVGSDTYCVVFFFVCLRLVYHVLQISLDYPFLITPSVFLNVYPIQTTSFVSIVMYLTCTIMML